MIQFHGSAVSHVDDVANAMKTGIGGFQLSGLFSWGLLAIIPVFSGWAAAWAPELREKDS
jgi:hypothetical protein